MTFYNTPMPTPRQIKSSQSLSVCFRTKSSKTGEPYDFQAICEIADQILVAVNEDNNEFLSAAEEIGAHRIENSTKKSEHEILNQLISTATSDWILLLGSDEMLARQDIPRLCYLLNHPIKPCYEVPIRYYSENQIPRSRARENTYRELPKEFRYFTQANHLKLFRKDAAVSFYDTPHSIALGNTSTLRCPPFRTSIPIHCLDLDAKKTQDYNRRQLRIQIAQAHTTQEPENGRAHLALGMEYLEARQIQKAVPPLERANQLLPKHLIALNALAFAYMETGRYDAALKLWQVTLKLNPRFHMAFSNIAVLEMRQQRFGRAVEMLKQSLSIQPDDPHSHYNLGFCYAKGGNFEEAIKHYRAAINFDPKYLPPYSDLGAILIEKNQLDEAEALLGRVLSAHPEHDSAFFNMGHLRIKQGRNKEGLTMLAHWISRHPGTPEANALLERLPILKKILEAK